MPVPLLPLALLGGSALAGGLSSVLGKRGKFQNKSLLDPNQLSAQRTALQLGLSGLQNPYAGFEPIEQNITQNAMNRFNQQLIPSIAERFSSLGGQRSSGFQKALQQGATQLSSDLASQLAAQKAQYGLQNQAQMMNLLGMGLRPNFERVYMPGGHTFLSGALGGLSSGLGNMAGTSFLGNMFNPQQMTQSTVPMQSGMERIFNEAPQAINPQQQLQDYLASSRMDPYQAPSQFSRELLGQQLGGYSPDSMGGLSAQNMLLSKLLNLRNTYTPTVQTRFAQSAWQ